MTIIQKSRDVEDIYSIEDPWGNRARGLYNILCERMVNEVFKNTGKNSITWCDIGCGGGNVFDGVLHNVRKLDNKSVTFVGVELSQAAIDKLTKYEEYSSISISKQDMQDFEYSKGITPIWSDSDVISFIEVTYFYDRVSHRKAMSEFWKSLKSGQLVIVADSLIPYQYRDYLKTLDDAELVSSYTDYTTPVSTDNVNKSGQMWTRWLKVRIYRKK